MILTLQGRISDPPHFIGIKDTKDKVKLEWVTEDTPITRFSLMQIPLGAVNKLCRLKGEGGGQKLPNLLSKKRTKRGEGVKNFQF